MTTGQIESDLRLMAACVLLALEPEAILEKAGLLEHDNGLPRDIANREALYMALNQESRKYSRHLVSDFFDRASDALADEVNHGWTRQQTINRIIEGMAGLGSAAQFPTAKAVV